VNDRIILRSTMGIGVQKWAKNAQIFLELFLAASLYVVDFVKLGGLVATGGIEPPTLGL
jgi:hypothetical protein